MWITKGTIEKVLDCDIVAVAEKHGMTLKKCGVRYKTICPYHNDTTPSLTFFKDTNQCHCFACGAHANVISLVEKVEGYDFKQATEAVAKEFDIEVEYEQQSEEMDEAYKKRESLLANMAIVEDFYHKNFIESEKAQQYAYARWGKEFCDLMRVGYAPDSICSLSGLGIKPEILQELGMTNATHDDIFRDRLTISIRDRWGKVVGFTCRNFDGSHPKYLNNADSEIFHKGEILFGLDTARKAIMQMQTVYLVEGAPDCYRLQSIGVLNAVACLGSEWGGCHFRQLHRLAKKVVFIPDADILKTGQDFPTGTNAVIKGGEQALQEGLSVYVKEIPSGAGEKQDADSYITSMEVFDGIAEEDFVLWYARKLFDNAVTVDDKTAAIHTMVDVLALIADGAKVDVYKEQLKKYTDGKAKTWNNDLKKKTPIPKKKGIPALAADQKVTASMFGFSIKDQQYEIENEKGVKTLSNFILIPLYHVLDTTLSRRIFEIENTKGEKNIVELRSEELVSNDKFEAKIGEIGNYVWWGDKSDLKRLKGFLFANMRTAKLIKQLGWQEEGFFAFGNGVVDSEEFKFHEADQYGIVRIKDLGYFYLPGYSLIYRHDRKMFLFEHCFIHREGATVTLREVTDQVFKVFGNNGRIAFLFLLACIYHDIIAYTPQPGWFPILDLFGPMGTGKTALAETMAAFFTKKKSINIGNATVAAMSDEVAAAANAVVVLNEYKNSIDDNKVEFLKGAWDLSGRNRFSLNKDGQREMTAVDSGIILTGQEMPTKDNALFSRTIFLTFSNSQFTQEQSEEFHKLASMREHGLTHLTIELLQYREKIEKEYPAAFYEACKLLKSETHSSSEMERITNNWAVPLAVYNVLKDVINIEDWDSIVGFIKDGIRLQSVSCKTSDELASFWHTLQFLLADKKIFAEGHFRIAQTRYVKSNDGRETSFDDIHPVLYLRKEGIIETYQEACKRIGTKFIPKESLEFYMKNSTSYLGYKKFRFKEFDRSGYPVIDSTKPIGNGEYKQKSFDTWAYCFDYTKLQKMYELDFERTETEIVDENSIF